MLSGIDFLISSLPEHLYFTLILTDESLPRYLNFCFFTHAFSACSSMCSDDESDEDTSCPVSRYNWLKGAEIVFPPALAGQFSVISDVAQGPCTGGCGKWGVL